MVTLAHDERWALWVVADGRPHSWGADWLPDEFYHLARLRLVQVYEREGRAFVSILPAGAEYLAGIASCVCPDACDCQSPDTNPALCSNVCPVHNLYPDVVPACPAEIHRNGAVGRTSAYEPRAQEG